MCNTLLCVPILSQTKSWKQAANSTKSPHEFKNLFNSPEASQSFAPQANMPAIVDFQPYMGKVRKPGTGCISQINDHLFEGRYSPTWIDGKKHARNVYAHTREECEEKLKVLIAEMKAELAELKRQKGDRH